MYLELGVGDHEANGFVYLAKWKIQSLEEGRKILSEIDAGIPDEAAGDPKTDPFTFFMDVWEHEYELLETSKKSIPLQMAQRLAPEHVREWLTERPDPDSLIHARVPFLAGLPSISN